MRIGVLHFGLICLGFICSNAMAVQTAYLSFQEPTNWSCELAQGVWICQSSKEVDRKESVVLSIAAQATEWDSLENYEKYLNRPKKIQNQDGTLLNSNVVYTRRRNINGFWWIDSLQQNSELPGFWARYLATIHQSKKIKLAILVTYIVSEERYSNLAPSFEQMVTSLKPIMDVNIATNQGNELDLTGEKLGKVNKLIKDLIDKPQPDKAPEVQTTPGISPLTYGLGVAVILALFILMRRRKKKSAPPPPSQNLPGKPNSPPDPKRRTGS